jgi:endoglucanase
MRAVARVAGVAAVALIGVGLIAAGNAATWAASSEAEGGVRTGAAEPIDAVGASGNRVIRFGSGTPATTGYTVRGNAIYDAAGQRKIFHGLDRPSLEWSSTGERLSLADYQIMAGWKANVIRLPLNQRFWLDNRDNYQATVAQQVQWITGLNMDVILDLHWSDKGNSANTAAQQVMADQNSVQFWRDVAGKYKANPRVMFELYNEPHDVSWQIWRNGGTADGFQVAGMQQLYDAVRGVGAPNLVIIGGTNWAFDLSGVPSNRITGTNIVYATHPYDFAGKNTPTDWDTGFGNISQTDPVLMTEFGNYNCSPNIYTDLIAYAKTRNIGWTGWAWYPGGCGFPALINDWNGTTTVPGQIVKDAM